MPSTAVKRHGTARENTVEAMKHCKPVCVATQGAMYKHRGDSRRTSAQKWEQSYSGQSTMHCDTPQEEKVVGCD